MKIFRFEYSEMRSLRQLVSVPCIKEACIGELGLEPS